MEKSKELSAFHKETGRDLMRIPIRPKGEYKKKATRFHTAVGNLDDNPTKEYYVAMIKKRLKKLYRKNTLENIILLPIEAMVGLNEKKKKEILENLIDEVMDEKREDILAAKSDFYEKEPLKNVEKEAFEEKQEKENIEKGGNIAKKVVGKLKFWGRKSKREEKIEEGEKESQTEIEIDENLTRFDLKMGDSLKSALQEIEKEYSEKIPKEIPLEMRYSLVNEYLEKMINMDDKQVSILEDIHRLLLN